MKKLSKQLFKLLRLHSPSGKEWGVQRYLLRILQDTMDKVDTDGYGNILAEKKYGDSDYTVLLSAHMDTVAREQPDPKWRKNKSEIFTASRSALGGDDKCGVAAHLAVIRALNKGTKFNGTVKICFSREEEIGCVGASEAVKRNKWWFEDVDSVIVIDRRGADNIVTGSGWERFCSSEYAHFWMDMAEKVGFKAVPQEGSISDTMIFSEMGLNGVNLSAGYYNAHTEHEFIVIEELKRTVNWVVEAFENFEQYGKFPDFEYTDPRMNQYSGYLTGASGYKYKEELHDVLPYLDRVNYCDNCGTDHDWKDLWYTQADTLVCSPCVNEHDLNVQTLRPAHDTLLLIELEEWGIELTDKVLDDLWYAGEFRGEDEPTGVSLAKESDWELVQKFLNSMESED